MFLMVIPIQILIFVNGLGFQWYSIHMTLEWLNSPNYGESWNFGTDFLVIISWLLLILVIPVLYFRALKNYKTKHIN